MEVGARSASRGVLLSVAAHLAAVAGAAALGARGRAPVEPIELALFETHPGEVQQLPLGHPAASAPATARTPAGPRRPRPASRPSLPAKTGVRKARADDGPEGSDPPPGPTRDEPAADGSSSPHEAVLVRLDRLRGSGYEAAIDQLLMYVPERRAFLQGTGLDLWTDFDDLLLATPRPGDPSLTLLAARHHLAAADLRAALTRGAESVDQTLVWRSEPGRLVGDRRPREAPPAHASDDRTIALFDEGLAVVAPPSYQRLLLGRAAAPPPERTIAPAPGTDGGAWESAAAAIGAEEALMPADAVVRFEVVGLLAPAPSSTAHDSRLSGLDVPPAVSGAIGVADPPFLNIEAELANGAQARAWQARWPEVRRQLCAHPYAAAWPGLAPLIGRVELTRDENVIRLHVTVSPGEARWLLGLALKTLADRGV